MLPNRPSRGWLAMAACLSLPLQAAEWVAEPSIQLRGEYNDNVRLTTTDHGSSWAATLDPRLHLARRTQLWDLGANARLRGTRYTGEHNLDTVDQFLDASLQRRFERGSFDASAGYVRDTTLQNEFLDQDTGLVTNQIDRTSRNLRLAGKGMFNERTFLEAAVSYRDLEYEDGARSNLLDYDYFTPSLTLSHQLNAKTRLFGVLSHSRLDYDSDSEFESKTDSLQLGASHKFTETWTLSGSVGSRRTRTSSLVQVAIPCPDPFGFLTCGSTLEPRDSRTTGLVYNLSLERELETGNISLSASRSVTPSSTGSETDTTTVNLSGSHRFTPQLSARLVVSYLQSETVGGTSTQADADRYRVSPSLRWQLDRDLALSAGYHYTRVTRDTVTDDADSNAVYVSLGYSWPRMAVSR
ncbi:MAG: outer membrane beta-barrel protein [Xanthomonadaceae bacterium]|nr:outer membrane beta-barrel protein [Xanthomonadaceae bacterium]